MLFGCLQFLLLLYSIDGAPKRKMVDDGCRLILSELSTFYLGLNSRSIPTVLGQPVQVVTDTDHYFAELEFIDCHDNDVTKLSGYHLAVIDSRSLEHDQPFPVGFFSLHHSKPLLKDGEGLPEKDTDRKGNPTLTWDKIKRFPLIADKSHDVVLDISKIGSLCNYASRGVHNLFGSDRQKRKANGNSIEAVCQGQIFVLLFQLSSKNDLSLLKRLFSRIESASNKPVEKKNFYSSLSYNDKHWEEIFKRVVDHLIVTRSYSTVFTSPFLKKLSVPILTHYAVDVSHGRTSDIPYGFSLSRCGSHDDGTPRWHLSKQTRGQPNLCNLDDKSSFELVRITDSGLTDLSNLVVVSQSQKLPNFEILSSPMLGKTSVQVPRRCVTPDDEGDDLKFLAEIKGGKVLKANMFFAPLKFDDQKMLCSRMSGMNEFFVGTKIFDDIIRGPLTGPDGWEFIDGDGHCLFRAISWWVTGGSQDIYEEVRSQIGYFLERHLEFFGRNYEAAKNDVTEVKEVEEDSTSEHEYEEDNLDDEQCFLDPSVGYEPVDGDGEPKETN